LGDSEILTIPEECKRRWSPKTGQCDRASTPSCGQSGCQWSTTWFTRQKSLSRAM